MTSNAFDLQVPATEIQIAEAIRLSDPGTADTIRRLAFERDRLKEEVAQLRGTAIIAKAREIPGTISLEQAKRERRCRICGARDDLLPFTYNFGREYAHSACLKKAMDNP